jgi:hypothetical protein
MILLSTPLFCHWSIPLIHGMKFWLKSTLTCVRLFAAVRASCLLRSCCSFLHKVFNFVTLETQELCTLTLDVGVLKFYDQGYTT